MGDKNMIFRNNIVYPSDTMLTLKGYYVTSKDEKVIIETKDINREKRVDVKIRGFSSLTEGKKMAEVLSIFLMDNNGFIRLNDNITIEKNKSGHTIITLKWFILIGTLTK